MVLPRWRRRCLIVGLSGLFGVSLLLTRPSTHTFLPPEWEAAKLEKLMNTDLEPSDTFKESSFNWSAVAFAHLPPSNPLPFPFSWPEPLPKVQYAFLHETRRAETIRVDRRRKVRCVAEGDWRNYRKFAWKKDVLTPKTGGYQTQLSGWAATLIDSLDTLWIMGFREEFDEAVAAVANIDFGKSSTQTVNIFETTIRYLGGLLAAYDLSQRQVLLHKAIELGDFIYAGFNTPNQLPVDFIDFEEAKLGYGLRVEEWVVSASPGSLSLEMTRLSQVTGDCKYYSVVAQVMQLFSQHQAKTKLPGLWPLWISMRNVNLHGRSEFTLGGGADSLFEYLPKMYALLGGRESMYKEMSRAFVDAAKSSLFFRPMVPGQEDILISGSVDIDADGLAHLHPVAEHLTCFIGGTVALAGKLLQRPDYVETGSKLAKGCVYAYHAFKSGIMPERFQMMACKPSLQECEWDESRWQRENRGENHIPRGFTSIDDSRYLLRPEAIESLFVLYRITGDPWYQDAAWTMFEATISATAAAHGHASVRDVTVAVDKDLLEDNLDDYMESYWLAETLKYYYLIFSPPGLISLDDFIFNTEAHPFKRVN